MRQLEQRGANRRKSTIRALVLLSSAESVVVDTSSSGTASGPNNSGESRRLVKPRQSCGRTRTLGARVVAGGGATPCRPPTLDDDDSDGAAAQFLSLLPPLSRPPSEAIIIAT
jgi:hypothetical protein